MAMALIFPNRSRSFDDNRKVVRFSGYDGMLEVRFLIDASALRTASQPSRSEAECLRAFDEARDLVLKAAHYAYGRGGRDRYTLSVDDIRRLS
jgi:hypothetical protein